MEQDRAIPDADTIASPRFPGTTFRVRIAPTPRPFVDVLDLLAEILIDAARRDGEISSRPISSPAA